ncbi:peptidyl-prolyl cis-trans isomerase [Bacillus sp. AGMB 02131]|uniref:Peptidyl-prolyl cis-trans isomerase n=1 Tax=Peribacillus faecalis TaxID=2772559 RepID=A0A927CTE4_9BACI|nr:peptidyl-prolyl cis-trans isomerase [Peribacillus faecalis]MBD3106864.1 peptidyl-prolyl cis-trans isomerase [Peribacillus faecalis]
MESIVQIKGNVGYSITLDPSVWLFDDRKQKLEDFFGAAIQEEDQLEAYTKAASEHWDREVTEGATPPSEKKEKKKTIKEQLTTETFGILFRDFLKNSAPTETAETVIVVSEEGNHAFPIEQAYQFVLCFSNQGKALTEDGPIHVYYNNNDTDKITKVREFIIE